MTDSKRTGTSSPAEVGPEMSLAEKLQAIADEAERTRLIAPEALALEKGTIPQKELIRRYAAPTGGEDGEFHWLFIPERELQIWAQRARAPFVDENGKLVRYEGDVLCRCKTEVWKNEQRALAIKDRRLLASEPDSAYKREYERTSRRVRPEIAAAIREQVSKKDKME